MKRLFLLSIIFCSMISCSKDQDNDQCKCDVDVVVVDPEQGAIENYTISSVPSDCEGNVDFDSLNLQENHWFQRTKNCK